jgi:hypothetical protein
VSSSSSEPERKHEPEPEPELELELEPELELEFKLGLEHEPECGREWRKPGAREGVYKRNGAAVVRQSSAFSFKSNTPHLLTASALRTNLSLI